MTTDEILGLLRTRLAVKSTVVAQAFGVGHVAITNGISRGAVPTIDLGKGSRVKPVPSAWVRQQLRLDEER